ncbi:hypothetical protein FOXB_02351, partial [Fusarium oxysporum f. sp. conglutinans Fo5176]
LNTFLVYSFCLILAANLKNYS